jgi:hypothetical protein
MKFTTDTILMYPDVNNNQVVFRNDQTLGYQFINTGNCPMVINNLLLNPGAAFKTFERGYVDCTVYRVLFNPGGSCGSSTGQLTVIVYSKTA